MRLLELSVLMALALLAALFLGGVIFGLYFFLPAPVHPYQIVLGFIGLVLCSHLLSRLYLLFIRAL